MEIRWSRYAKEAFGEDREREEEGSNNGGAGRRGKVRKGKKRPEYELPTADDGTLWLPDILDMPVTTVTFCNPHQRIPESSASFPSPHTQSRNLTLIPDSEHPFLITLDHSRPDRLYLALVSSSSLSLASSHTLPLPLSRSLRLTLLVLRLRQPYTT